MVNFNRLYTMPYGIMARAKPLEATKYVRVHYADYARLHTVTSKEPQPQSNIKPQIRVYISDHATLQDMAWSKSARIKRTVTLADIVHDIISIYDHKQAIPIPEKPHNTIHGIIHGLLQVQRTAQ